MQMNSANMEPLGRQKHLHDPLIFKKCWIDISIDVSLKIVSYCSIPSCYVQSLPWERKHRERGGRFLITTFFSRCDSGVKRGFNATVYAGRCSSPSSTLLRLFKVKGSWAFVWDCRREDVFWSQRFSFGSTPVLHGPSPENAGSTPWFTPVFPARVQRNCGCSEYAVHKSPCGFPVTP